MPKTFRIQEGHARLVCVNCGELMDVGSLCCFQSKTPPRIEDHNEEVDVVHVDCSDPKRVDAAKSGH